MSHFSWNCHVFEHLTANFISFKWYSLLCPAVKHFFQHFFPSLQILLYYTNKWKTRITHFNSRVTIFVTKLIYRKLCSQKKFTSDYCLNPQHPFEVGRFPARVPSEPFVSVLLVSKSLNTSKNSTMCHSLQQ